MALEKQVGYTMEVLEDGQIQVKEITRVIDDGVFLSQAFHRHVVSPGDDLSREVERVRAVAEAVHTPEVIADFLAAREAARILSPEGI